MADESTTVQITSARGRPLKRTQPFEPLYTTHAKMVKVTQ